MLPRNSSPLALRLLDWLQGWRTIVMTVVVCQPVLHTDVVAWDKDHHIYANLCLPAPTWSHVAAYWQAPYLDLYIPVLYTGSRCYLCGCGQPGPVAQTAQQAQIAVQANHDNRLVTQRTEELSRFRCITPLKQSLKEYIWPSY